MNWSIIAIVIQLIFLEGLLSIDNAAVLGAMVTALPKHEPIPWPGALRWLGKILDPVLGKQRSAALKVGLLGAYFGRGIMLFLATLVINNPWLKIVGALYLVRLTFENLGSEEEESALNTRTVNANRFWHVVLMVELTDLVFSLDNVVAAVALSNKFWVILVGVAIGILVMRFAAGLFAFAIEREPILRPAAYLLVFNIGIELILEEFGVLHITDWLRFAISVGSLLFCLAYAHIAFLQKLRPVLGWIGRGFGILNMLFSWILEPLGIVFILVGRGLALIFGSRQRKPLPRGD